MTRIIAQSFSSKHFPADTGNGEIGNVGLQGCITATSRGQHCLDNHYFCPSFFKKTHRKKRNFFPQRLAAQSHASGLKPRIPLTQKISIFKGPTLPSRCAYNSTFPAHTQVWYYLWSIYLFIFAFSLFPTCSSSGEEPFYKKTENLRHIGSFCQSFSPQNKVSCLT